VALIALVCFFLSGASGLVFEVVWTRELGLVFGSTTLAISTVLSVFMGGLALGSALAGRVVDRLRRPLVAYALVEAGVGAYGLLIPLALTHYPAVNASIYRMVGEHPGALALLRFASTALLLLLPTTLMGATLPLLSRYLVARQADFGRLGVRVGALYTANTLGAVVGTFIAGFVLLPDAGVRATNAAAACTNIALAVVILASFSLLERARRRRARAPLATAPRAIEPGDEPLPGDPDAPVPELDDAPEAEEPAPTVAVSPRARRVALWAFACSGAAAMTYQVLWSRALAIVIGSSVYSFTLILLAFLVGLAGGAALWSRLSQRSRDPVTWLAATHMGVVAMVVASYLFIDKLPALFVGMLKGGSFSVDGVLGIQFVLAALPILPATIFMGGVMPLTVRIYTAGLDRVGRDIGVAYSVNTLGSIIGSFAAGFVVLPLIGLQRGLFLAAVTSAAVACALFLVGGARPAVRRIAGIGGLAATIAASALLPRWDVSHFQAGLFRVSYARDIIASGKWPVPQLLSYKDGISTTVSVEKWNKHLALKNNGKVDASNGDDMATQIMVGLMPLLLHPTALDRPPRALVIGYGSGVTVGAVTQFPIAHADVVELEPEIVRASKWFAGRVEGWPDVNHRPDENPRVSVILDDGRNFLGRASRDDARDRYDVIVSEPSNPWITGVSNLFTRDYWELARGRLADDGVFCQWAQLYEMSPANIKVLLGTFASVFPYTYVFAAEDLSSDVILVAAKRPLPLDRRRLARNFEVPSLKAELHRADVDSADDVIANILLTPDELPAFTAGATINTDDNAHIEFAAPRDLIGFMGYDRYLIRVYGSGWPYGRIEPFLAGLGDGRERAIAEARLAEALLAHGRQVPAARFVEHARSRCPSGCAEVDRAARLVDLMATRKRGELEVPLDSDDDPLDAPSWLSSLPPAEATRRAEEWSSVLEEMRRHRWAHALQPFAGWPEKQVDEAGDDVSLVLGFLLYKVEMEDDALDQLRPAAAHADYVKRRPALLYYLARSFYLDGLFAAGVREMKRYLALTK
jgi:spermidine synthase